MLKAMTGSTMQRTDGSTVNFADIIDESGRLKTTGTGEGGGSGGGGFTAVTLQDAATAVSNGTNFAVSTNKTITVEITGTSTSRTVIFEGSSVGGSFFRIQGARLSDLVIDSQTTGSGEVWQFEVTGLVNFRARISAIAGGNVSVKGRALS